MMKDKITLYWKGLPREEREIGTFIVTKETLDKIDDEIGFELSIDIEEELETDNVNTFEDVMDAIKNTDYGKLLFTIKR